MRYAIYFTPDPNSELHRLGSTWLGRDAENRLTHEQPDPRLAPLTEDARRYGFHATLKPPFYLKEAVSRGLLERSVTTLATQHQRFVAGHLRLKIMDGFLALVLDRSVRELEELAEDCVERLDDFRTPPDAAELRRRRTNELTARQEELLQRWGYPYVLDEFRFHLTLTRRLSEDDQAWVLPLAQKHFATVLGQPLPVDALTLMVEPAPGSDFHVHLRLPLFSSAMRAAS
jgi:putative phosphonate metabolism protein